MVTMRCCMAASGEAFGARRRKGLATPHLRPQEIGGGGSQAVAGGVDGAAVTALLGELEAGKGGRSGGLGPATLHGGEQPEYWRGCK
jgi:hypothetical protein